jgi:hypothetical protein
MGGSESKDVNRTTTHICALSMDHPKVQAAVDAKVKAKIVLPHWSVPPGMPDVLFLTDMYQVR